MNINLKMTESQKCDRNFSLQFVITGIGRALNTFTFGNTATESMRASDHDRMNDHVHQLMHHMKKELQGFVTFTYVPFSREYKSDQT